MLAFPPGTNLCPYLGSMCKLFFFSSAVHQIVFLCCSSLPFAVGQVQDVGESNFRLCGKWVYLKGQTHNVRHSHKNSLSFMGLWGRCGTDDSWGHRLIFTYLWLQESQLQCGSLGRALMPEVILDEEKVPVSQKLSDFVFGAGSKRWGIHWTRAVQLGRWAGLSFRGLLGIFGVFQPLGVQKLLLVLISRRIRELNRRRLRFKTPNFRLFHALSDTLQPFFCLFFAKDEIFLRF